MISFEEFKKKALSIPEVAREYEAQRAEFEIARALIKARVKAKMTQAQVAEAMHTSQSQIAKMESGNKLPSVSSLFKYAKAVNQTIHLDIIP